MRKYSTLILLILILVFAGLYLFSVLVNKSSDFVSNTHTQLKTEGVEGTFEATTPCSGIKPPLPLIPEGTNCEMTIWMITFNSDKTYTLLVTYGMTQPNSTDVKNGGTRISLQGRWSHDPDTRIINLAPGGSQTKISFIKITDELIHLLDADKKMMVGNGGWSYTLNKTNSKVSLDNYYVSRDNGKLISGVFEGRTPCQDFLLAFTKSSVNSPEGCQRIKWVITFYLDESTGKPSRYVFGIQDRKESHRGSLHIVRGTSSNPDAVVYQLIPDNNRQVISLLKVGDDHLLFLDEDMNLLVGNNYLSYTLSKTADSYEARKSP